LQALSFADLRGTLQLPIISSGATLFVIGSHAGFRELEGSDMEELLMEPV
jgi:hypothetical protein